MLAATVSSCSRSERPALARRPRASAAARAAAADGDGGSSADVASRHAPTADASAEHRSHSDRLRLIVRAVEALQAGAVEAAEGEFADVIASAHPSQRASAENLAHYLSVRRSDHRQLQARLCGGRCAALRPKVCVTWRTSRRRRRCRASAYRLSAPWRRR